MYSVTLCGKPSCRGCPVVEMDGDKAIISETFEGYKVKLAELKV